MADTETSGLQEWRRRRVFALVGAIDAALADRDPDWAKVARMAYEAGEQANAIAVSRPAFVACLKAIRECALPRLKGRS